MKRSIFTLALVVLCCLALFPISAMAEGEEEIPNPPVVSQVEVCASGGEAWVEVTISTPTSVRNFIKTLRAFGLADMVSSIQASISVDGGDWKVLDMSAVGETKNLEGIWRSAPISGLKTDSALQLRVRYYGMDENKAPVMSPWSEIVSFQGVPFEFNAHDWAKAELAEADGAGLIPESLRAADLTQPITRAEFAAVSVRVYEALSGLTAEPAAVNPFTDTADAEVLKALNVGVTNGTSATEFSPEALLNREQAATMLSRVYKKVAFEGWTLGTDGDYAEAFRALFTMPEPFADDGDISAWARDSVYFMAANGVLNGVGDNRFAPKLVVSGEETLNHATREQAILIAVRLVKNLSA